MTLLVKSLAVKYRPNTILGLVGQSNVVRQVTGMINIGAVPPAILISGDTGCGKTTTSRIIARTVNCKNLDPETLAPCGTCQPCELGENSPDYLEVNVGDNRTIEYIRSLIEGARAHPIVGNTRIIVLDEVHQLLAASANALLKAIEEPPPRTLWILATTNPEKLLPTIVGRCTKLVLTKIKPEAMAKRIRVISKREGVDLRKFKGGEDIVNTIIDLSNGQMRDAISILESALFAIKSGEDLDSDEIISQFLLTGDADYEQQASNLLVALYKNDLEGLVKITRSAQNARALITKMRWIIQHLLDDWVGLARYTPYGANLFKERAKKLKITIRMNKLIKIQYLLTEIECRFNTMSLEESVVFLSMLGNFVLTEKALGTEKD